MIPLEFEDKQVRTIVINGEPWFVAKDVAVILEYRDAEVMTRKLDADEKGTTSVSTPGGKQRMLVVSEAGLYNGIMRSKSKKATPFRRWVTHEVLPTIRKTGGVYMTPQKTEELLADPDLIIGLAMQVKQIRAERDEAIRTKAWISDKKTASAMGTASAAKKENRKLKAENEKLKEDIGLVGNYRAAKAIPWLKDYFFFPHWNKKGPWIVIGQHLSALAKKMEIPPRKQEDFDYDEINLYHVAVINRFKEMLNADEMYCNKYRKL